jgi:two-component system, sensor histidine kinase
VQALGNVLLNAAKFTPDGGDISVAHGRRAARAWVTVRDTGTGLSADLQRRVFDLFVQEDATLARSRGGLGVGLTVVKRIAELHGGSVDLRSEGPGRGCEVTFELPALPENPPTWAPTVLDTVPAPTAPLRVLIVEDNGDAAETFQMVLSLDGHETQVAADAAGALTLIERFEPDIAFIDLGLPDMDGLQLARRLRANPRMKRTVLTAVTGYGRDEDKARARAAGFDHHLTKPVQRQQILDLIAGLQAPRA